MGFTNCDGEQLVNSKSRQQVKLLSSFPKEYIF